MLSAAFEQVNSYGKSQSRLGLFTLIVPDFALELPQ
jgi:hypothetical protein